MSRRCAELPGLAALLAALAVAGCASQAPVATPQPAPQAVADVAAPEPDPPEAAARLDRAITLMNAGDLDRATQELTALSASYPAYAGPLLNLGITQLRAGKLAEAEQAFKDVIARNPDNSIAYNQLAIVHRRSGRFAEAKAAYERALALDDGYALAHFNLGVLCDLYLGEPEEALAHYERYLELVPEPEPKVAGWVKELKNRLAAGSRSARSEP